MKIAAQIGGFGVGAGGGSSRSGLAREPLRWTGAAGGTGPATAVGSFAAFPPVLLPPCGGPVGPASAPCNCC